MSRAPSHYLKAAASHIEAQMAQQAGEDRVSSGLGRDLIPSSPRAPSPCDQLPSDARERLVRASQVREPLARRIAIEEATEYARIRYPQLFQPATAN